MSKNPKKQRRMEEARRKAWMKRHVPRSGTEPKDTEYRQHLLYENEANVALAIEQSVQQGENHPAVFVIDCRDMLGYALAVALLGEDKVKSHIAEVSQFEAIPTLTLAIPHKGAADLLKTLKCSPVALPTFSQLPPEGWYHVVVVAAGGNLFLAVKWPKAGDDDADCAESCPDNSEPSIVIQVRGWTAEFRISQDGKYLVMCLAMAVGTDDYVYAPVVGWTDDFCMANELLPQAMDKYLSAFPGLPNVMLTAIVKKSDTDEEVMAAVLEPLFLVTSAAAQGKPLPGVQHGGISYILTASPNLDSEELELLGKLGDHIVLVQRSRADDKEA